MKKLLFQLDTDPIPNTFDTVVAYDGGADHVTVHGGITPDNVGKMVDGAIFTRAPSYKKYTALFVTGSNMAEGEAVFAAIKKHYFGNFRVSLMLDSNGSNTTAAAGAAYIMSHIDVRGKRVVILAGTGPVGQRAGVMLASEGAEVIITSRKLDRSEAACAGMKKSFNVDLVPAEAASPAAVDKVLEGAHIVMATGAAGVQLLAEEQWRDHPTLQFLIDANATPPLGIGGVEAIDKGVLRHGKVCFGALGFGGLKLEVHRACVEKMFETNKQSFDGPEIFALARELLAEQQE
jgi:hypothetical protein